MKASSHARDRVRRLGTRHGNRCRDDRGEGSTNPPLAIWRFPMLWKTGVARARGDFEKKKRIPLYFTGHVGGNTPSCSAFTAPLFSHPSASNSEHKLGTRDQKSWRVKPRQDLRRRLGQSRFPSRGIPRRYLFSTVLRGISLRFPDLEALLPKPTRRSMNTVVHISQRDVTFRSLLVARSNHARTENAIANRDDARFNR